MSSGVLSCRNFMINSKPGSKSPKKLVQKFEIKNLKIYQKQPKAITKRVFFILIMIVGGCISAVQSIQVYVVKSLPVITTAVITQSTVLSQFEINSQFEVFLCNILETLTTSHHHPVSAPLLSLSSVLPCPVQYNLITTYQKYLPGQRCLQSKYIEAVALFRSKL